MGKIVTVAIHKGGTGKTTIVSHLAFYAASKLNLKVLVVDMDAQGNISAFFDAETGKAEGSSSLFFEDKQATVQSTDKKNIDLIAADDALFAVERIPLDRATTYRKILRDLAQHYDLVIVDTPPTMGFAMLAPVIASDYVISPVIPDVYSVKGIRSLFAKIKAVKAKQNPRLQFLGLIINRWTTRNSKQREMVATYQKSLSNNIISQPIGDRSAIANAAYESKPVWEGAKSGAARSAAKEMLAVMQEIMNKMGVTA